MLSVALTYQKVLLLVSRFIVYLVGFALTTRLLDSCLTVSAPIRSPFVATIALGALILGMFISAATDAALLAVLRQPEQAGWRMMWKSARRYTGVIFWLKIRITLIAVGVMIPFGLLIHWFRSVSFVVLALAFVYLFLMKYALAYPLAVDQQLDATQALRKSWEMTRGHFWYVLLCYVLMAALHFAINHLFSAPWLDARVPWSAAFFIKHLFNGFLNSLWIVLGWQMYLEIKDADRASEVS